MLIAFPLIRIRGPGTAPHQSHCEPPYPPTLRLRPHVPFRGEARHQIVSCCQHRLDRALRHDSCTVCKSSAPGCKNKCTCASINPGISVQSPRSITSAPAGRFTEEPTSTIRSPCTSTSPGFTRRPLFTSSSRAACNTIACEVAVAGCVCAAAGPCEDSTINSSNKDKTRNGGGKSRGIVMASARNSTT